MVDINDVLKKAENKKVIKAVRVTQSDDDFLKKNKIDLSKVVDVSIKELKEKIKKETGVWK